MFLLSISSKLHLIYEAISHSYNGYGVVNRRETKCLKIHIIIIICIKLQQQQKMNKNWLQQLYCEQNILNLWLFFIKLYSLLTITICVLFMLYCNIWYFCCCLILNLKRVCWFGILYSPIMVSKNVDPLGHNNQNILLQLFS